MKRNSNPDPVFPKGLCPKSSRIRVFWSDQIFKKFKQDQDFSDGFVLLQIPKRSGYYGWIRIKISKEADPDSNTFFQRVGSGSTIERSIYIKSIILFFILIFYLNAIQNEKVKIYRQKSKEKNQHYLLSNNYYVHLCYFNSFSSLFIFMTL